MSQNIEQLRMRLNKLNAEQRKKFIHQYEKQQIALLREVSQARNESAGLSSAQQRLWYLNRTDSEDPSYNIPGFFAIEGEVSVQAVKDAFAIILERHEVLRTGIMGDPPQLVSSSDVVPEVEQVEIPEGIGDAEPWVLHCASEFVRRPFDIAHPPLGRLQIICSSGAPRYLVCSFHHLVFDGWSLKVFIGELLTLLDGDKPAPLTWNYRNYALLERGKKRLAEQIQLLCEEDDETFSEEDFWKSYLHGIPQCLALPGANAVAVPSNEGKLHVVRMNSEVWQGLQALGRQEDVTPFSVALGLFSAVLAIACGENDVVLGTPVSGRNDPATHELIGTFVNTVPLRMVVDPDRNARHLVRSASQTSVDALSHEDVPFERIVDIVNPLRLPGIHPIFRVLFTFQPAIKRLTNRDVALEYRDLDFGTAKFDLSLDVVDEGDTVRLVFEYRTDVLSEDAVVELAQSMLALADQMVSHPDISIGEMSIVDDERRHELVRVGRGPDIAPEDDSVLAAFERTAASYPLREAIRDARSALSYAELDDASSGVARRLSGLVNPGDVVAIALPRCVALFSTILGVWKTGGTPLVIDPALPLSRIQAMVDDSDAIVVTERGQLAEGTGVQGRHGHAPWFLSELPEQEMGILTTDPEAQAYLVYTSGSTGVPKGILVSHKSYSHVMQAWRHQFGLEAPGVAQIASSAFDVFYGDIARAFGTGGRLVLVSTETAASPEYLTELLHDGRVDFAEFVPSVFRRLASYLSRTGKRLNISHVVVASEKWTMGEARIWITEVLGEDSHLHNTYGLAETTIDSTSCTVRADDSAPDDAAVPIGRPLPNASVYVVSPYGQLLPRFVVGEILIGGQSVDNHYIGGAQENNDKYTDFTAIPGEGSERVYHTGDYGYLDAQWRLVFVGRRDGQVKVRGVRIELTEVDDAVRQLNGVSECASVIQSNGDSVRLIAWVVSDAAHVDLVSWRAELLRDLPTAMVPEIVLTDSIPLLDSGKVDRKQLEQRRVPVLHVGRTAPRDETEQQLCELFCDVLDRQALSVDEDFFALGGHSLTALDLVGRINRLFDVDMKISDLFGRPTVEGLAQWVQQSQDLGAGFEDYPVVEPDLEHRYDGFPLTEVQQAYWLGRDDAFEFSGVSTHSYDEFHGYGIDPHKFADALNEVIDRHDMMRCVIVNHNEQRVLQEVPRYDPIIYDLRDATSDETEAHLTAIREELSHQRLDVTTWPNFDIRVSVLPGDLLVLHFSTDALLLDAKSFVLVSLELSRLHDGLPVEPVPDFHFRDYVLAEIESRNTRRFQRSEDFWKSLIPRLPAAPDLPMRGRPDDVVAPRFTRLHARIEKARWDDLKGACGLRGLTPSSLCLAAYATVLARYSRSAEFSINMTFLSRKPFHEDVEKIVGEFTSVTLLPIEIESGGDFLSNASAIQRRLWEVLEYNDMTGVRVQREYAHYHGLPSSAHFPVVFTSTLGGMPMPDESFPMRHQPEYGVTQTSQVWLDCGIWEDYRGDLRCNWDVVREVYPPGMLEAMFEEWISLIESLGTDSSNWESAPLVTAPAPLAVVDAPRGTLLDSYRRRVSESPDATAVVTSQRTLTYRQVDAIAGGIVRRLRELEVRRGELVAVLMEPGWEQLPAVLGIVGEAAYVPVSPAMPDERLAGVIEQAGVRVILTQPQFKERADMLTGGNVVVVDDELSSSDGLCSMESGPAQPDDLAYVIFTSGSTGTPKGVMISHCAALNTIEDVNERYGVTCDDVALAVSELSFDLSVYDIFGMMSAGGAVVVPDRAERLDPICLAEMVKEHGVTIWNSVPALFQLYLGALDGDAESSLRIALLSGDWIPLSLPPKAADLIPRVQLHSLGGATEASIWSITYPITDVDPEWASIPYGVGMRYQDVLVLDHRMSECRDWVTGDLYIRGYGLALGYWRDPEQTSASFVNHPVTGERMYRTGDLGRRRPDGVIEFLGRSDFQLKVGGYRVEAGEVEKAVSAHPAVREAVVVAVGSGLGDKRLACAWTRADHESDGAADELSGFVAGKLQEYMVPSLFKELDELPLSANGKVDRQVVASMFEDTHIPDVAYVAPSGSEEVRMVELWESVLPHTSHIGMHDDFFGLGGSSMDAIELVTRIRRAWNVPIRLGDFYEANTPSRLLEYVRRSRIGDVNE
ncbi:non-ribosomal peptide synthetase [Actinomyces naeslundii]|uniref:non-ribosomal peptide synthetase n=1 Tax=Actinomyces naeslundii TaxID=1655 RepID=UPI0028EF13ED|nr:non-ribosomal peptide synthetase [Actinomyces naeslundii]